MRDAALGRPIRESGRARSPPGRWSKSLPYVATAAGETIAWYGVAERVEERGVGLRPRTIAGTVRSSPHLGGSGRCPSSEMVKLAFAGAPVARSRLSLTAWASSGVPS